MNRFSKCFLLIFFSILFLNAKNITPEKTNILVRNENDSRKHQLGDNSLFSGNNNVNLNSDEYIEDTQKACGNFKNPYETLCNHIANLDYKNYKPEKAAVSFIQEGISLKKAKGYAIKLKEIYAYEGIYIKLDTITQDNNHKDPIENYNKYKISSILPQIYLVKVGDKWVYSRETLHDIDILYKKISRFRTYSLYKLIPKSWKKYTYNTVIWQYVIVIITIIVSIFISLSLLLLLNVTARFLLKLDKQHLAYERCMRHARGINKALAVFITTIIWLIFIRPTLDLPVYISRYVVVILKLVTYSSLSVFAYRFIDGASFFITRGVIENRFFFHLDLLPLIRKVLKVCVIILGVLGFLKALKFDISALLTSISFGSLGIALAAQDTIKNLFGSVMIFIDKPFSVGDMIFTKDFKGRVLEIGMRSTLIKTPEQTTLSVPNSILANTYIDNKGLNTYGDFNNIISISAKTDMKTVEEFIVSFRNIIDSHVKVLKVQSFVNLIDVNEGEYKILFSLFFNNATYYKELIYRHEILIKVVRLGESLGLSFNIKK